MFERFSSISVSLDGNRVLKRAGGRLGEMGTNMAATKEDIQRVHERIDNLNEAMTKMSVAVERLATTIELMPKPQPRPCEELRVHLDKHAENMKNWKSAVIEKVVSVAAVIIIGLFIYWLTNQKPAIPEQQPKIEIVNDER